MLILLVPPVIKWDIYPLTQSGDQNSVLSGSPGENKISVFLLPKPPHTHTTFFLLAPDLKESQTLRPRKVFRGHPLDLFSIFLFLSTTSPPSGIYLNTSGDGDLTTLYSSSL